MGVSIEQWRCAIASAAPLLRVTKKEEKHDGMLRKMRDDSFKLWSFVGVGIMWLILVNWVLNQAMLEEPFMVEKAEICKNMRLCNMSSTNVTISKCGKIFEGDALAVCVIKTLLVIGNVEQNPGPEMQPKLNLYRLLRQVEKVKMQSNF